jgi:peroxiredoxin
MSQLRDIAANIQRFQKLGVRVLAISVDTPDQQRKVYESAANRKFSVLSDADLQVIRAYGLLDSVTSKNGEIAIRTSVFIDEKGIEQWRRVSGTAADIPKASELLERIPPVTSQ